jgi:hypothetical protein
MWRPMTLYVYLAPQGLCDRTLEHVGDKPHFGYWCITEAKRNAPDSQLPEIRLEGVAIWARVDRLYPQKARSRSPPPSPTPLTVGTTSWAFPNEIHVLIR